MDRLRRTTTPPARGDVVLGWLTRLVVVFAVVGVIGFDGISVLAAKFTTADQAATAARDGSISWQASHDVRLAYDTAVKSATDADPANEVDPSSFSIDPDGTTHLTVHRVAPTFALHLIGPLRHLASITAAATGRPGL